MTNPNSLTSLHARLRRAGLFAFAAILAIGVPSSLLAGCEKKKPPPVVEAPPPPPPPIPEPVQVDPIMAGMAPSAKVQFPQTAAPHSEGLAKAVIAFADALAKGDATKFGAMLQPSAKGLLAQLEGDGRWADATAKLEAVRIVLVEDQVNPDAVAAAVYFATQTPEGADVMGWSAMKVGDQWTFTGAPASSLTKRRASEWDHAGMLGLMSDSASEAPDADLPADVPADAPPTPAPTPESGG